MLRLFAILLGIIFIVGGVMGYMPQFMNNGLLFGYLEIDSVHNLVHMITGVLAIMAATNYRATKIFFAIFGLFYTAIGIVGFWQNGNLFITHTDLAGNIFHIVIGVIALYLGFSKSRYPRTV